MAYQIFTVPLLHGEGILEEMNAFLNTHKLLAVTHRPCEMDGTLYESFLIEYLPGDKASAEFLSHAPRVDYKEKLSPEDFEIYLKLTRWRKAVGAQEGQALFAIFNNEQLAAFAEQKPKSLAELEKIPGVGKSRLEKYGKQVLEILASAEPKAQSLDDTKA